MQTYEKQLRQSCERWFWDNYSLFLNRKLTGSEIYSGVLFQINEESGDTPEYHLQVSTGPWKSLYVKFKQPGETVSATEKEVIRRLREQEHRVEIIRCVEDFRTLMECYLPVAVYA